MTRRSDDPADEISTTRRQFLRRTGSAGLLALGAPALAGSWVSEAHGATKSRSYAAGQYGLELDGMFVGFLTGFSGGNVTAEVIREQLGPDLVQKKRLGALRVEPITIETGLSIPKPFQDWIRSSIEPNPRFLRKNGAIIEYDMSYKEMGRRQFFNAAIAEVEFPACDAASKDAATLAVTFVPEKISLARGSAVPGKAAQARPALRSNFKLNIQGLEQATVRAARIEPFEIKASAAPAPKPGEARASTVPQAAIEIPNLIFTVSDAYAAPVYAWHEDFVTRGNNSRPDSERTGVLEFLAPDLRSALLSLTFFNLGIIKVSPEATATQAQDPRGGRQSRVEMYCESVKVDFKG